jgi:ATP-dependent Clp protease ATP-binding subunit ClpA
MRKIMAQPQPQVAGTRLRLDPELRNPDLSRFRELMDRMVIGQPDASDALADSMSRVLAGVGDPDSPVLSLMLMGPTGVGKTETVRCLAEALFGDRRAFTRVNCQEYSAHYNLSKLLGSPPGYVGGEIKPLLAQDNLERHHREAAEEGRGMFNDSLARLPRFDAEQGRYLSLVCFDEIEKAHPKLWNLLLGILEDGVLVLGNNEEVDFTRSIIMLTTNVGSRSMGQHLGHEGIGFSAGFEDAQLDRDLREAAMREAKKVFPFEFLNRFDSILTYDSLKQDHLYQILDNLVSSVHLRSIDCTEPFLLRLDHEAKDELVRRGTDPQFGARPLRRAVEINVVTPISHLICSGQISRGDLVSVGFCEGDFVFEKEHGVMTAEEIEEFEALREERERSRDLEGSDDGGEANRIVEEVDGVIARSRSISADPSL